MDYTTLKNIVFENYYFNSYLPGTLGSYESATLFNYLLAAESIQENLSSEVNISKTWVSDVPTWYTNQLPDIFFVPKFSGESDQEYLNRLLLLTEISQNENTIITAVFSVTANALLDISQITIVEQLDGSQVEWGNVTNTVDWDGVSPWSDDVDLQRTLFLVDIEILNRGSPLDSNTWDYWILSTNYTKIEDMVNLYKPPGSTFEIRLTVPTEWSISIDVFSNTLII